MILTWLSRRKAGSASITRRPPHQSRRSRKRPGFHRSHSYDCHSNNTLVGAAFMLHQLTSSSDRFEANLKSGFKGSTFHPPRQSAHTTGEADEESQTCLSPTSAGSVQTRSHGAGTPPRPVSFWGNNGFPTQSPPPANGSILRAYGETCTWVEEEWNGIEWNVLHFLNDCHSSLNLIISTWKYQWKYQSLFDCITTKHAGLWNYFNFKNVMHSVVIYVFSCNLKVAW